MENIPFFVSLLFILTTIATLYFFYRATRSKVIFRITVGWLIFQTIISATGFYTITTAMPPRLLFLIGPPVLAIITLFILPKGKKIIDHFDPKWLTWLNTVRAPVEVTLLCLFLYKQVPQLMTFEGRNFDILSGLSAPVIAWLGYHKHKLSKAVLLSWNFVCLGLLLNIVINAILAAPFPFQQFAFDQPNVAVLHFPYIWLPCFIVPAVLLTHLTNIRLLLNNEYKRKMTPVKHNMLPDRL